MNTQHFWIIFYLTVLGLSLLGCQPSDPAPTQKTPAKTSNMISGAIRSADESLLANIPLENDTLQSDQPIMGHLPIPSQWIGQYLAVLPCADCGGIRTTLAIKLGNTYSIIEEYLGQGSPTVAEGKLWWQGDRIFLEDGRILQVVDGMLTQLGPNGKPIQGQHAQQYRFTKIK